MCLENGHRERMLIRCQMRRCTQSVISASGQRQQNGVEQNYRTCAHAFILNCCPPLELLGAPGLALETGEDHTTRLRLSHDAGCPSLRSKTQSAEGREKR